MKVGLIKNVQGRIKFLSTLGLLSLVGLSGYLQYSANKNSKILTLQEGMQTCQGRLHNSYTARLLGGASEYVTNGFTGATEDCFAQAISVYEDLELNNSSALEDLNTLATHVSWFHQKVTAKQIDGLFDGNPESVILSAIGSRYEKIELKKEQFAQALINEKNIISSQKAAVGKIFYAIAAILPLLLIFDFFSSKSNESELEDIKNESKKIDPSKINSLTEISSLVTKALSSIGLTHLARSFDLALQRERMNAAEAPDVKVQQEQLNARQEQLDEVAGPVLVKSSNKISEKEIEELWNPSSKLPQSFTQEEDNRSDVELEQTITNVIDLVSSKIFTMGIKLEVETFETSVYGEKEPLEQAFYHLLTNAIENYDFDNPEKYLSINVKKLGATIIVDFFDSGREFSKEFLRQSKGLATGMVQHTELAIAQSLIDEIGCKISFENVCDKNQNHIGRKAQVILEGVSSKSRASKRKLARLEKSTKKELLKKFQDQASS